MNLIDTIYEKENCFLKETTDIIKKAPQLDIYIYGGGFWAQNVKYFLEHNGIQIKKLLVNKNYYKKNDLSSCLEYEFSTITKEKSILIIIAFTGYNENMLTPYMKYIHSIIRFDTVSFTRTIEDEFLTYSFLKENITEFDKFYNTLEDDTSKDTLSAYINQCISCKYGYLNKTKVPNQYFMKDLIQFQEHEVFIDCGAYTGDTAIAFTQALKERNINSWDKIISFEPEPELYKKTKNRNIPNHEIYKEGISDKKDILYFNSADSSSKIEKTGDIKINVNTIDNILNGDKATFIKMDIEGAELAGLKGAEKTIKKFKPTLAICVYHKKEDLLAIPQYIHNLVPEYKIYLRNHENNTTELVLYAII